MSICKESGFYRLRAFTAVAIPAMASIADAPIATVTGFIDADSVSGGSLVVFTMVQDGSKKQKTHKKRSIRKS
jgi:hypothetical protein